MANYPAAVRVSGELRDRIARGVYGSGSWLPTERELSDEFGVSRPVVRMALAELALSGLLVRQAGCRPRVSARNTIEPAEQLRTGSPVTFTRTISVILPQHPTYVTAHAILRGISHGLRRCGAPYLLSVIDTHRSALAGNAQSPQSTSGDESDILDRLREESTAGVIIWPSDDSRSEAALNRLHDGGIPVVCIDRRPADGDWDYVGIDNREAMRSLVEYLLGLGHRRIAYITGFERVNTVVEREEGYRDALSSAGLSIDDDLVQTLHEEAGGDMAAAARRLHSLTSKPTAVVALSDLHAFSFIRAAGILGWPIPEGVSVAGFDDIESYSPHPPVLTTVHQPFNLIGERAAALLVRRLESGSYNTKQHILLPTSLVVRSTCRPPMTFASEGTEVVGAG